MEAKAVHDSSASMAILTKSRAMYGKRIQEEQYKNLLHKKSVSEIVSYLKNETSYSNILSGTQESLVHRKQLENLLRKQHNRNCNRLSNFLKIKRQGLYNYFDVKREIEILLLALRYLQANQMNIFYAEVEGFIIPRLSFDVLELSKCDNYQQFMKAIARTTYCKLLKEFIDNNANSKKIELDKIEKALYTYYYQYIFKIIRTEYKGSSRKQLEDIFYIKVQNDNNSVIYRMKKYFGGNSSEIINKLIMEYDPRSKSQIQELAEVKNVREFLEILNKKSSYPDIEEYEKNNQYFDFEFFQKLNMLKYLKKIFRISTDPAVVFVAYVELGLVELENIINIIEGVRYNISENEIKEILLV